MKFLGADVGGTKTRLAVCNEEGEILAMGYGGPGNHLDVGMDGMRRSILTAMKDAGVEDWVFDSAFFGMAGAGFSKRSHEYFKSFMRSFVKSKLLEVANDCVVALRGALGVRKSGLILVAGTGSMVIGRREEGKIHRVGGWGHLFGDPGSAYGIAFDALKMIMKYWEGRGKETSLSSEIERFLGLRSVDDVIRYFYTEKHPKSQLASFAPIVLKHAERDDEVSKMVVMNNVRELVSGVKPVSKRVNSNFVSYSGGVFSSKYFKELVGEELEREGFHLSEPEISPVGGALLMAMSKVITIDEELLKRLKRTLRM